MTLITDILKILNGIKTPCFIVDKEGIILHANAEGERLRVECHDSDCLKDFFRPEISDLLQRKISESMESSATVKLEKAGLIPGLLKYSEAEVTVSSFDGQDGSTFSLCTLYFSENTGKSEKLEVNFSSCELQDIIKSDDLIKIFEEIKSSFPFTFLGKNRIQNEINKLDEFFWLKDSDGKYILVNTLFAQFLGLKPVQVEGKFEKDFLPKHLSEILLSVDKYIKETSNLVIRNGFPLYLLNGEASRIIEIPLCDLDNRVIAVVGLSQKNFAPSSPDPSAAGLQLAESALRHLPQTVLVAGTDGIVKSISGDSPVLRTAPSEQPGKFLSSYLPPALGFEVENFLRGEAPDKLDLRKEIPAGSKVIPFVFHFRKIYNYRGKLEGFLISVEEDSSLAAFSNTIGNKGKMYEILMQTSPEAMFIYDTENLRFLEANQAALQMYGYSRHEFMQMDLTDLYAPEDIQTLLDSSNSRNKEGVFTGPWKHRKKDGSSVLVEISKSAFDFQDKKAYFNIIKDVSHKADLEKDSQFFNAAFDSISDLMFITDPEGFITRVNNAVTKVLGYSKAEMDMRPFITLASDSYRAEINTSVFYSKSDKPVSLEAELKKNDGSLVRADLRAVPVFDYNGQVNSFSIIVRTLQDTSAEPSHAEPSGAETLGGMTGQAESSLSKKSESSLDPGFLSGMFHEILTPMNVILGFIQELTENIESPTSEQKEAMEIIRQNRAVLMQTMDSVLEYSHIEQNRVEVIPQRVFFTEIVDELQKSLSRLMEENQVTFNYGKISTSLNFETDRHRLESFLSMFIRMVLRITKESSIFLSAYQYDDRHCLISLKDRRASVSPYLLENLTDLFTAEETSIRKDFGISKLTIRLVRRLLRLLLGKIEVVKRAGEPSEFGFLFPLVFKKDTLEQKNEGAFVTGMPAAGSLKTGLNKNYSGKSVPEALAATGQEDMDIIEEGEITGDLESALKAEEQVRVFDPDLTSKEPDAGFISGTKQQKTEKHASLPAKIDLTSLQCLYVEDQIDSQILFKVQMKDLKRVDSAVSFEAALPLLQQNKYDFIIMDINLQGEYNGLDALRIIRRLPGYTNIPVIAVTAYILAGDKEKFIAAGFNGFISKPVMRDKVIDTLEKLSESLSF